MTDSIVTTLRVLDDLEINACNLAVLDVARMVAAGIATPAYLGKTLEALDLVTQSNELFNDIHVKAGSSVEFEKMNCSEQ